MRCETVSEYLDRGGHIQHVPPDARGEHFTSWASQRKWFARHNMVWELLTLVSDFTYTCVCEKKLRKGMEGWRGKDGNGKVRRWVCSQECRVVWEKGE